jgi:nitroreductase/FMN reductase [NAD(P)H]
MSINHHIQSRFGLPTETGKSVEGNETVINILTRRSHRAFKTDEISQDLLDTLLATAFSAPSKSDLQQACVIHVQDKSKQERIAYASPKTRWVADAPVFLVWCGDSRRIRKLSDWRGHPFANDHLDAFMNAAVDAGICMQTFLIAAESFGLGGCPVSEIRDHIQLLSDELELPQHVFPVAGLCVGWPLDKPEISMRLPMTTTVKTDTYDDGNLIEEVAAYDIRREAKEKTKPEQQRYVDEFGVSRDYGWSENRTRQYSRPARDDFGTYIRKQGFNLS